MTKHINTWAVLIALLIGTAFSFHWMYGLYQQNISDNYEYVPIRFASETKSDDLVYYSIIRNIIDGHYLPADHVYEENRHFDIKRKHWAGTYHFSLLMSSIGGLITGSIEHAYYFNHFFYPAINFLLIFFLMRRITCLAYASLLLATIVIIFPTIYDPNELIQYVPKLFSGAVGSSGDYLRSTPYAAQIDRTPNLQFTNIQLFVFVIFLYLFFQEKKQSLGVMVGLILSLGISSITSIHNFLLCYSIFLLTAQFYFPKPEELKKLTLIFGVSSVLSIPGIWINIGMISFMRETVEFNTVGRKWGKFEMKYFLKFIELVVIPFALLIFLKFSKKRFILGALLGAMIPYFLLTVINNSYYANKSFIRGSVFLISCLVFSALMLIIYEFVESKITKKIP